MRIRLIFAAALALTMTGCMASPQETANNKRGTACVDGVEYLAFKNAYGDTFAPHMKKSGGVFACGEAVENDNGLGPIVTEGSIK